MPKIPLKAEYNAGAFYPTNTYFSDRLMDGHEGVVYLTVEKKEPKRSDRYNRFYWGAMIPIIQDFHEETQGEKIGSWELHIYNCTEIMGMQPRVVEVFGKHLIDFDRARTSEMSRSEFHNFVNTIRKFFEEKGCDFRDLDRFNY